MVKGQGDAFSVSMPFFFVSAAGEEIGETPAGDTPGDETALPDEDEINWDEYEDGDVIYVNGDDEYDGEDEIYSEDDDDDDFEDADEEADEAAPPAPEKKTRPSRMNFEPIKKELPEVEAWIKLSGTKMDYPVMYGSDNEFYLNHLPNGKQSSSGSIFIDCRNSPDFSDPNTLIYGHRMKSGAMFGVLRYYSNQSYYDKHPVISIFTPDGDYDVELIAAYAFDQTVETPHFVFDDEEDFDNYIREARRRSPFKSGVEVSCGDRLVTLCTCEYTFEEGRLIVVGKLTEK